MIGSWIGIPTDVALYYYMFNSAWFKSRCEFTVIFKSRPIASKSRHSYDIPHALHVHVADFQGNFQNGEIILLTSHIEENKNGLMKLWISMSKSITNDVFPKQVQASY